MAMGFKQVAGLARDGTRLCAVDLAHEVLKVFLKELAAFQSG